ncbi:hypothetical protein A2160_01440 [Candidatus Beckwithbacteria bacterium RBG_13_42_9]|uniref:Uncharacterized protein n=1 Tax=Candidatus Beckwithbacteria bacterium RBG_13_42_9 TaxID=1797457 RepID=A0A1F5E918_9BACT|nr:MAG: hypothetical protein A2160_01440 [Candidatus Beckwithbacteria bacterium RBG_13_42_9]
MNKLFKYLASALMAILLNGYMASSALAADFTVFCNDTSATTGDCYISPLPNQNLFYETNWLPGDTITRNFTVDNTDNPDACDLLMRTRNETQTPGDFATKLWTVIKQSIDDLYGVRDGADRAASNQTLNNLFNESGYISLGTIVAGGTKVYNWTVTFDFLANNDYQNAQTQFDFDLSFACGQPGASPSPTASPTPTPSPNPEAGKHSSLGLQGSCNADGSKTFYTTMDLKEDGHPKKDINVKFTYLGATANDLTNDDGRADASFTLNGVGDLKAEPDSGYPSLTQVVHDIDCATGTVLGVATGGWPQAGWVFAATEGTVEGATATASATPSASLVPLPMVEGASTCTDPYYPWWLPLVLQGLLTLVYFWFIWRQPEMKGWWFAPVILSLLSQLIHEILGCNCGTGRWCPWYWVFNLIILLITALFYYYHLYRLSRRDR